MRFFQVSAEEREAAPAAAFAWEEGNPYAREQVLVQVEVVVWVGDESRYDGSLST